jgi:hypothetical protein
MSIRDEGFSVINFKTDFLWTSNLIRKTVCIIGSYIYHYIGKHLKIEYRVNKGSLTIFTDYEECRIIVKVFKDFDNRLAEKYNQKLDYQAFVIALEIGMLPNLIKDSLRDELRRKFRYYLDPRIYDLKTQILPNVDYCYDIIFLERGVCETTEFEETYVMLLNGIDKANLDNKFFEEY